MKPKAKLRSLLLIASISLLAASSAHADQIWDGGSPEPGGDSNWSTAENWGGNTLPNFASTITFAGNTRNGAVNDLAAATGIGPNVSANAINFTNDGSVGKTNAFTLSGNSITLAGGITTTAASSTITDVISLNMSYTNGYTITTNANHNLTISGDISVGNVRKSGVGELTLSGNNTFGNVLTSDGTINVATINSSGSPSNLGSGTSIIFQGATGTNAVINYTGAGGNTDKTVQVGVNNNSNITNARINSNGNGALVFTKSTLIAPVTGTSIAARTLILGGANANANTIQGIIRDNNAGVGTATINLIKEDAGTWILSSANTYTGTTTANGGTLKLNHNLALQNSALVTTGAGFLTFESGITTPTIGGLSGASGNLATIFSSGYGSITALTLNPQSGVSVSYGGIISNGSGTMPLIKTGAGNQTLTGDNTFSGALTISNGSITVSSMKNLGLAQPLGAAVDPQDAGRIDISYGGTLIYNGTGDTSNRTFICNGGTGTIDASNPSGKLTLTGLWYRTAGVNSTYALKGTGLAELTQKIGTGANGGSTTVTKSGTGTWILSVVPGQDSTYAGGTNVTEGTLLATSTEALPSYSTAGKVAVASGATLAVRGGTGGWIAAEINNLLTPANFLAGSNLGIDVNDLDSFTYGNNIGITQAAKGLVKSGLGTLTLSTNNTYTGATTVSEGTLEITGATQATSSITLDTGAKLGLIIGSPVTAANAAVNLTNGTVKVTGTTGDPSYTLMTAFSIVRANPVLDPLIPGYQLVVVGGTELQLKQTAGGSPFDTWAGTGTLGLVTFGGDTNGDGVKDGVAFLLGAGNPDDSALGLLPTVSQSGGNLIMTFDCLATADRGAAALSLQYDGDLVAPWTSAAVPGAVGNTTEGNVNFVATANGDLIHIVATIDDAAEAASGKLFGRLEGTQP